MSCRALRTRAPWLVGLVLLVSGCGVADYENKMILAQQRIERWDKEEKMLGAPLIIPKYLDKHEIKRPWANLFIRPPLGIRARPVQTEGEKPEPVARGGGGLLYTYLPPPKRTAFGVTRVELAFGTQKDFVAEVLRHFTAHTEPKKSMRTFQPTGRQVGVTFETIELEGTDEGIDYLYSINRTATKNNLHIAVVYWVLKSAVGQVKGSGLIDLSLESFALDDEANASREILERGSLLKNVPQHPQ